MQGPRQPTHAPSEEKTEWPPEAGTKRAEFLRDPRQTGQNWWIVGRSEKQGNVHGGSPGYSGLLRRKAGGIRGQVADQQVRSLRRGERVLVGFSQRAKLPLCDTDQAPAGMRVMAHHLWVSHPVGIRPDRCETETQGFDLITVAFAGG